MSCPIGAKGQGDVFQQLCDRLLLRSFVFSISAPSGAVAQSQGASAGELNRAHSFRSTCYGQADGGAGMFGP